MELALLWSVVGLDICDKVVDGVAAGIVAIGVAVDAAVDVAVVATYTFLSSMAVPFISLPYLIMNRLRFERKQYILLFATHYISFLSGQNPN